MNKCIVILQYNNKVAMGASKTSLFDEQQNQTALVFKALGHPARVAIIEYLLKVKGCICNDIKDELQLAQATISQHLRELRQAGIIKGTVEGQAICYCLNYELLGQLAQYLADMGETANTEKCC
jgi:ArsR family transcriptional regulator, arsenate/arsenite/antimonite-responsive transcriptional repressor